VRHAVLRIAAVHGARVAVVDADRSPTAAATSGVTRIARRAWIVVVTRDADYGRRLTAACATRIRGARVVVIAGHRQVATRAGRAAVEGARVAVVADLRHDHAFFAADGDAAEHAARWEVLVDPTITVVVDRITGGVARNAAHGGIIHAAARIGRGACL
jgi:hypothetical protein